MSLECLPLPLHKVVMKKQDGVGLPGEMVQQLRTPIILPEDLSSILRNHFRQLQGMQSSHPASAATALMCTYMHTDARQQKHLS